MTDSLAGYFAVMARNNAWSNHRLRGACAALSAAELAAPRSGFFPSLQATLNHILIVDWLYLDALERGGRGLALIADEIPCQIHHRGQAHAMLSSTDVAPPQLDEFLLGSDAPLRADDLSALGLTEADTWLPT